MPIFNVMDAPSETVPVSTYNALKEDYQSLQKSCKNYEQEVAILRHELAQLKKMVFGRKSERYVPEDSAQMALALEGVAQKQEQPASEEISYHRKQNKNNGQAKRLFLPSDLPRREEVIEPDDCPQGSKKIGEHVSEVLEYTPGKLHVRRIVRPKYLAPETDEALTSNIHTGNLPTDLPLPKSNAGAGLLAHLMVSKYADHLPFHRQVKMFKREGIALAEATVNDWFAGACDLLKPLYDKLGAQVQQAGYLQADETSIPVLSKNKPGATHRGYLWVYRIPASGIVYFDYHRGRGQEAPEEMLKDFKGTLQTDGYAGYNQFANQSRIRLLACMAHARRKFVEAEENDREKARYALDYFKELYGIERRCDQEELSVEQRREQRQAEAKPVLEAFYQWLEEQYQQVLPQSPIGKAIAYNLNLWKRLSAYVEDGRWEIDNNKIENTIRPVALGRKNYLFAGSHEGAERAAMIYSFLGTCQAYGINPWEWLKHTLENIRQTDASQIHTLLPGQQSG